ncbi:MAG TPA: hypothetical protein VF412_05160 [Bdellovibrio sp.]|uniref:hypothetical protein n=1 Tax=Bdellovibrio sp. TaxID=28201 RepID=UPI002F154420
MSIYSGPWAQVAYRTLQPLSKAKHPLQAMLDEWFYNGNLIEYSTANETCGLCGHEHLKFHFGITNSKTENELFVGSECIGKFDLSGIGENGEYLDPEKTKQKVKRDRDNLIKDNKKKRALQCLILLSRSDTQFDFQKTVNNFEEKSSFSPNQLALIFSRFSAHKIKYKASDFKVSLRRDRNKLQLAGMNERKFLLIRDALSPSQRAYYWDRIPQRI